MEKTKIGIINCKNMKDELSCTSVACFDDFNKQKAYFARYKGNAEIVGMVTCNGCPTISGAQKILNRVDALVTFGAEKIHFSSCVVNACPFKEKYAKVIEEKYPNIEIIKGTHLDERFPEEEQGKMLRGMVGQLLSEKKPNFPDLFMEMMKNAPAQN
jgi:predicted metal-binding protein